jgi:hypothetical protein
MKYKLLPLIFLFTLAAIGAPPGVMRTNLTLRWDYPANELSTNLTFKIYSTTNLSLPVTNWPVFVTVVGTNLSHPVPVEDFKRFFSMTASNLIGEGNFSMVVEKPAPPRDQIPLGLQ